MFLQSIIVTAFTIFLSCDLTSFFSSALFFFISFFKATKSSNLQNYNHQHSHKSINDDNVEFLGSLDISDNDHFKGQKTINILPKSTCQFNPFGESFCLDLDKFYPNIHSEFYVPIKFNSSNEISTVEIIYTDLDNYTKIISYNKKQLKSIKVNDHHKFRSLLNKDLILHSKQYSAFTKNQDFDSIVSSIDSSRISFVELPIKIPGLYKIGSVIDVKGLPVKVYNSNLIVANCPKAKIHAAKDTEDIINNKDFKCIGDYNNLKINIVGVPPLRLKYTKLVNEYQEVVEEKLLLPSTQDFKSPLTSYGSVLDSRSRSTFVINDFLKKLSASDLQNFFKWSSSHEIELAVHSIIKAPGDYSYILNEIEDGFGNTFNLSDTFKNEFSKIYHSKGTSLEDYLESKKLYSTCKAYSSPKFKLVDKVINKPLIEKEKRNLKLVVNGLDNKISKNLEELKKIEPVVANVSYVYTADGDKNSQNGHSQEKVFKNYIFNSANNFEFVAESAGTYSLDSVKLKYCPGLLDDANKKIEIFRAFKPELTILSSTAIDDTCLGQIGLRFELLLTGIPSFEVKVNIYKFNNNNERKLIGTKKLIATNSNRINYSFEPEHEGNYEVEFSAIHDNIYKKFIDVQPIEKFRYRTSMRAKPDAIFLDLFGAGNRRQRIEKRLCLGSSGEVLPVKLIGEAPFELTYDVIEKATNRRKGYTAAVNNSNAYSLKLPVFTKGGDYVVSLTSVKGKADCTVQLNNQDIHVKVKKELPYAAFESNFDSESVTVNGQKGFKIKIKEGDKVDLPLKVVGEKSIALNYKIVDSNGELIRDGLTKSFSNYNDEPVLHSSISASNAGVYYLTGIKDSLCLGQTDEATFYNISYYSKPELIINQSKNSQVVEKGKNLFEKQDICLNEDHNVIDLVFRGVPPFMVDYSIELPNGSRKQKSIKTSSHFISIDILGDLNLNEKLTGSYKYVFRSISDSIYSRTALNNLRSYKFENQVIRQSIRAVPTGRIIYKNSNKLLQICSNNLEVSPDSKMSKKMDPVILELEGQAPFGVQLEIFNENFNKFHTIFLNNVTSKRVELNEEIVKYLSLGNHFISLKKIIDGKDCVSNDFSTQPKEFSTITSKSANDVLLNHQMMISITDAPSISKNTIMSDLCIGEYVDYKLHGTGPFEVKYLFNNEVKSSKVKNTFEFKRILMEQGSLEILSIIDTFGCVAELDEFQRKDSKVLIHDKPTVEILDSSDEHIQEGDEVEITFKFTGVPPFNLIYQRLFNDLKDSEIYHVKNIEDNEYKIKTSLQGSYIAIELKDAYCEVRRNI